MNHGRSGPADPTGRTADCAILSNPNLRFTLRMLKIRHISRAACAALPHVKNTGTVNIYVVLHPVCLKSNAEVCEIHFILLHRAIHP